MVIFRILFNLLFLPFKLLGIPMAIFGTILHLLMRNLFLIIIVVATILVYRSCTGDHSGTGGGSSPPPIRKPVQAANRGNGPIIINPVTRTEDGDSAFATDVYGTMSDEERAAYSQVFYFVMSNKPDTEAYPWSNLNIGGTLRANDTFTNNVGVRCRHFSEVLKVHEVQQTISGIACEEGNGAWCKLKTNATPGCNLGQQGGGGLLDGITGSLRNLF